jgi:hypothetical protein
MTKIDADASPEKRLFISLITRDISLVAAFLDLIDNSVNAAVEPYSARLSTAADYESTLNDDSVQPTVDIKIALNEDAICISDTASGISSSVARDHVFRFGRSSDEAHQSDRLSVYGIGMKRALFKLGNNIKILSDHVEGGFDLDLDVGVWAKDTKQPWTFPLTTRAPAGPNATKTEIRITNLTAETRSRINDGIFIEQLKEAISQTYAFYLAKFVHIYVNDTPIKGREIAIGRNRESDEFSVGNTTCAVTAGIAIPTGDQFKNTVAGWYVLCNGRTVISADKSSLTGWIGGSGGLPIFQPKHRAFIGTVFFVSKDAEELPWNTTKSGINEDSAIWQQAKRTMASVGRKVISFLDGRYTEDGTEVSPSELKEVAGPAINAISAAVSSKSIFNTTAKPRPKTTRIQFDAKPEDVERIAQHLGKRNMSGREAGEYTFNFFLRNEVGEK